MPTPERTSIDAIVAAGQEILEANGPAGLTMQAVAERVGVRAPSLYKRVRDREALRVAVATASVDALATQLEAAGDDLSTLARTYRTFAHAHPEGFRLMFNTAVSHQTLERSAAPIIRACTTAVGEADALDAARLFTAWATGFLQMELSGAFRLGGDVDRAFDYGLRRLIASLAD
ncbi:MULTISPECIES: TetR/AcrR family transcriptional regulator [Microbacterium]|uniref:TetR/AcrR family transcriptional regulator n=1 Tax=Microbacterium TaxID=33882 RepID=UPI0021A50992|nr:MULTISPECIES: TetR/AcrR family transcriptional regulator [Microbacterium]MCT1365394.1 TetR/AcrR family transcriptional regulator [Microbacterium sp. p3-SID131]MCT1375353.1 TetR/AcrR family transcriptional regulator [Microbacterium sp. p3-SID337]MCZ0709215.1 WHG domain-containing protein [Microbacterium paraoxydans]